MENKILAMLRRYDMVRPGDRVICAVSGGADSMGLLWSLWMLRERLQITVEAAHFNHHLRGEEAQRDEDFVRSFCAFHDIPLHLGSARVQAGKKGLEAAAREARYAYLLSLPGIIATAHTADDNAETVLMHLIRGTGLRGLGGITPKTRRLIRPMLELTRQEVEAYLAENFIDHVEDSSNESAAFFRNRVRQELMPLLRRENPGIVQNLSAMAQRLREDEQTLSRQALLLDAGDVVALRNAPSCLRRRALERLLVESGLPEPNSSHLAQAEALVLTDKPSAFGTFPGGVVLRREYDRLVGGQCPQGLEEIPLPRQGTVELPGLGLRIRVEPDAGGENRPDSFRIFPRGEMVLRPRQPGDCITLPGGTKTVKKLLIDRKIPAAQRDSVPIVADEAGILGIGGIGPDVRRTGAAPLRITFEAISPQD